MYSLLCVKVCLYQAPYPHFLLILSLNLAALAFSTRVKEKWFHSLGHLNTLSPISGIVLGVLGITVLLEEAHLMLKPYTTSSSLTCACG